MQNVFVLWRWAANNRRCSLKKTEEEKLLHSLLNHFLTTLFAFSKNCHSFKSRNDASWFEMEGKNRKGNNLTVSVKFFGNFFLKKNFGNFWVEWWSLKSVLEKKEICHQGFGWKTDLHWDKSLRTCTTSTIQMAIWPKIAPKCFFGQKYLSNSRLAMNDVQVCAIMTKIGPFGGKIFCESL